MLDGVVELDGVGELPDAGSFGRVCRPGVIDRQPRRGAVNVRRVERGEGPEKRLKAAMDRFLDRDQERALFELPPRSPN